MTSHSATGVSHERPVEPRLRWLAMLWINIGTALQSLRDSGFRAALTVLGVVIGVAAVIILVAFGQGAEREIVGQIDTLGTNVAVLVPGKLKGQKNFNPLAGMGLSTLKQSDLDGLREIPGVKAVAPVTFINGVVFRGEKAAEICLPIATTPEFMKIRQLKLTTGRFLTEEDLDRQVCVLGLGVWKDLFGTEAPLGEKIAVNDRQYEVIGVVQERSFGSGLFGGEELDSIIYLPKGTVQKATGSRMIHRGLIEVDARVNPDSVVEAVRQKVIRAHGGRDDFSLVRAKELLSMFYKIFNLVAYLLLGITSISLVVGGIGIMNIMLVAVTERTREIGIRKTVGARQADIFLQFLTEAVALSVLGGVAGILLALLVCWLVTFWTPLRPLISAGAILLGFGVCVAVGVISGVLPAISAARKDPIEAIRFE